MIEAGDKCDRSWAKRGLLVGCKHTSTNRFSHQIVRDIVSTEENKEHGQHKKENDGHPVRKKNSEGRGQYKKKSRNGFKIGMSIGIRETIFDMVTKSTGKVHSKGTSCLRRALLCVQI